MKKIILATDAWHPQRNGVVRCVENTKKYLEEHGFEVTLIHPGLFFSLPLIFYPEIKIPFFTRGKIKRILAQTNPDYIHIFTEGAIGLMTRSLCVKQKLRFSTSLHTHFPHYSAYYLRSNIAFERAYDYLKWFHGASAQLMVLTEKTSQEFTERGLPNIVWPLGVNIDLFQRNPDSKARTQYNLVSPVFVYFGRIAKEKNLEEYLKLELPGTKLIIGDGPERKKLEKKYGKTNRFLGYQSGQPLIDLLSACDVFVFPSHTDSLPYVIIEALACGIPVAAHNVMGLDSLVTPDIGRLGEDLKIQALECLTIDRSNCRKRVLGFSMDESGAIFVNNLVTTK